MLRLRVSFQGLASADVDPYKTCFFTVSIFFSWIFVLNTTHLFFAVCLET